MDINDLFLAGKSPKRELQLQGPRPPPLSVRKDSHKIRKPPVAPANRLHHHHQPPPPPPRQPVIIYAVSPKVIHTNPNEFMALVQRLTGSSTAKRVDQPDPFVNSGGAVSPAARYATVEKANKSRVSGNTGYDVSEEIYRVGSETGSMQPTNFITMVRRFTGSYAAPWVNQPDPFINSDGTILPVERYANVEKAGKLRVSNDIGDDMADGFRQVGSQTGLMPPGILSPGLVPSPNDFITLFHRFTGSSADQPDRTVSRVTDDIGNNVADEFKRVGSITGSMHPGILSPGPASLRPVPAAFFSPPSNGNPLGFIHDLISPAGFYNKGLNYSELSSLLQSPTPFVSPRIISPLPSMDLFNHFFDL